MEHRAPEAIEPGLDATPDKSSGRYVVIATIALLTIFGVIAWLLLSEPESND